MRTALVTTFDDTVNYCFGSVLETMGPTVRELFYDHLSRHGIPAPDISTRFDDVVKILSDSFGGSVRVIVYRMLVELYQQYSMRVDFTYQESMKDHLALLKERVVTDHLVPKRAQRDDDAQWYRITPLAPASGTSSR